MVHLLYAFNDDSILFEVDPSTSILQYDLTFNQLFFFTDVRTQSPAIYGFITQTCLLQNTSLFPPPMIFLYFVKGVFRFNV